MPIEPAQVRRLGLLALSGLLFGLFVLGRQPGRDDGLADFYGASLGLIGWSFSPWKIR